MKSTFQIDTGHRPFNFAQGEVISHSVVIGKTTDASKGLMELFNTGHPNATSVAQTDSVEAFARLMRIERKVNSGVVPQTAAVPYYLRFNKRKY